MGASAFRGAAPLQLCLARPPSDARLYFYCLWCFGASERRRQQQEEEEERAEDEDEQVGTFILAPHAGSAAERLHLSDPFPVNLRRIRPLQVETLSSHHF